MKYASMKVFFDLDDTLFDTGAFARGAQRLFAEHGISEELFWKSYREMRSEFPDQGWSYSFDKHRKKLLPYFSPGSDDNLRVRLESYISTAKDFLFPEVLDVLFSFKERGYPMSILTFGDVDFQRSKVIRSGLGPFMEDIIVTDRDKGMALRESGIGNDENIYFFDDKVVHIESVKKAFPHIRSVLVKRASKRNSDEPNRWCDHVIGDMLMAKNIVF